jgi:hypothetical protein
MASADKPLQYQPLPDDDIYREAYANNIYFEQSAWDLKLIFGQVDQREGKVTIRQHTAITLPWTQVKLLSYWLRGYVESYEGANGKIRISPAVIPPDPPPPTEEMRKADPNVDKIYELFRRLRNELLEDQRV